MKELNSSLITGALRLCSEEWFYMSSFLKCCSTGKTSLMLQNLNTNYILVQKLLLTSMGDPEQSKIRSFDRRSLIRLPVTYLKYISPLHSKPHKWGLHRAFVRKTQTGETAHFKCNIKQSACLSQRILCNEARECPCNSLQTFQTLWNIILQKVRVVYVCEELEESRMRVFLKQTQHHHTSG